jgi:hypothetical protein
VVSAHTCAICATRSVLSMPPIFFITAALPTSRRSERKNGRRSIVFQSFGIVLLKLRVSRQAADSRRARSCWRRSWREFRTRPLTRVLTPTAKRPRSGCVGNQPALRSDIPDRTASAAMVANLSNCLGFFKP